MVCLYVSYNFWKIYWTGGGGHTLAQFSLKLYLIKGRSRISPTQPETRKLQQVCCRLDATCDLMQLADLMQLVKNRREQHVLKLVKKCVKGIVPQFLCDYFSFNRHLTVRTTRQSNLLHLPRVRTEMAKKSFYYNGAKVFNRLCHSLP